MENPLVVVGSGLAGYLFAKEFRHLDSKRSLIIITATDGRFYSKPLLSTALTHQKTVADLALSSADKMAEQLSAKIVTHAEVVAINTSEKILTLHTAKGEVQQTYGDLVLACGANKVHPTLEGNAVEEICSVNNIEDYEIFRDRIVNKKRIGVIGSGLVACEFSNDLINSGYEVTIVAPEAYPLAKFVPEAIGSALRAALQEKGVHWLLGPCVKRVDRLGSQMVMHLDNEDTLEFDLVFSATGLRPNIVLAKSSGIQTQFGIVVNSQLQTNVPHIYAIGDCAEVNGEVRQYVAPLLQSARTLAKVLVGESINLEFPVMPIVVKTPASPVIIVPPSKNMDGEWVIEGEDGHLKALYQDAEGRLLGFVLMGRTVREKMELVKQISRESIV